MIRALPLLTLFAAEHILSPCSYRVQDVAQPAAGPANSRCFGDLLFTADREAISMQSGGLHAARVPAGARLAIAYQMFWHL
jgi:hypothetical protein